jgi:hypothetical protein
MTHEALQPLLSAVSTQAGEEKLTERQSVYCSQYGMFLGLELNTRDLQFRVSEGLANTVLLKSQGLILDSPGEAGVELRLGSDEAVIYVHHQQERKAGR